MAEKKHFIPIVAVILVIALLFAAFLIAAAVTSAMGYGVSVGKLYFLDDMVFLVENDTSMIVSDQSKGGELFSGYSNGDKIILLHDGVEESLPARTGGYFAVRISKGEENYKPADDILGIVRVEDPTCTEDVQLAGPIDFHAEYVRTDGHHEDTVYPVLTIIRSVDELNDYYNANKDRYYLERQYNPHNEAVIGFLDVCDKYDEEFFSEKALIFIMTTEGSGSIGHRVERVSASGNEVCIEIKRIVPEGDHTCDTAQWHIIVEVDNAVRVKNTTDLVIYMDGILETDDKWKQAQPKDDTAEEDIFSFSLTWNTYGVSSYDSETGRLVKTTYATDPSRYVTFCKLNEEKIEQIYALIEGLDIASYPDVYNPHDGKLMSDPSMTLILSVKTGDTEKTFKAEDIAMGYDAKNRKGQKFLDVCKEIRDIITDTAEWKVLPEYEFLYD